MTYRQTHCHIEPVSDLQFQKCNVRLRNKFMFMNSDFRQKPETEI